MNLSSQFIGLAEVGAVPDFLIRMGIRKLCKNRLKNSYAGDCEAVLDTNSKYIDASSQSKLAPLPEKANAQHYEVPAGFYKLALGPRLKYSCCHWEEGTHSLEDAEVSALELTCNRAKLANGLNILEIGCGWGSLTLWMAAQYPKSQITAVSNSNSQREHILSQAKVQGLDNIKAITCDINDFDPGKSFDRIVSVEMFEHVRNHRELFRRLHAWLNPGGYLFSHVFCHRTATYAFDGEGDDDWMSQHFFSGGTMPSDDLFLRVCGNLEPMAQHRWSGTHYARTAEAWLYNLDLNKEKVLKLFSKSLPKEEAKKMFHRWRIFFLACAETFNFGSGQEWWVSHYLFQKQRADLTS